jgi:DNA-binding NarL/FixJ family response regulator
MQLVKKVCVLMLGLAMFLAISSVVRADAVTDWNALAIQTIAGVPSHPGATALLDSAMVQVALYDAVEAITGRFRPYHVSIAGASGSPDAAVGALGVDLSLYLLSATSASSLRPGLSACAQTMMSSSKYLRLASGSGLSCAARAAP